MATATATRTYTAAQEAARDYMQAAAQVKAIEAEAAPHKGIMKAALDALTAEYGVGQETITGCWNRPLVFTHAEAETVKWAKVNEALRPHLTAEQVHLLDRIIEENAGTRTTRNIKVA